MQDLEVESLRHFASSFVADLWCVQEITSISDIDICQFPEYFSCRSFHGSNLELYEKVILRYKGALLVKEKFYAHYFFILYCRITIFQERINEVI